MKPTTFKWGWQAYEPTPDPLMTRETAARLLRAWRRSATQGVRDFSLSLTRQPGAKVYAVSTTKFANNDAGVLVIPFSGDLP